MGFRYRKSINLGGGFRVNLSKNGIGYSWGTKGYRITKTADGRTRQTVSIPGTGISYVDEHKAKSKTAAKSAPQENKLSGYQNIQQVSSADAGSFRPAEYDELFKQIKKAKLIVCALAVITLLSASTVLLPFMILLTIAALFICPASIEYTFDDAEKERWESLSAAWREVASSQVLAEVTLNAKSKNTKITAGIENAVDTEKMSAGGRLPWYLKTNINPVVFRFITPAIK